MKNILLPAFFIVLSMIIFSCGNQVKETIKIPNPDQLDSILTSYVDRAHYPFIYARLEDLDGNVIYDYGAKNTALLPDATIDENAWIRIWSMSKIVTISLALDLVEDGIIKLEDPVIEYIPEFENLKVAVTEDDRALTDFEWGKWEGACPIKMVPNDSVMTILHLINHQAGFYYATTGIECIDSVIAEQNLPKAKNGEDLIRRLAKLPLIQHPGTTDFYGLNTTILGLVMERATKNTLQQLVEERLTTPLNINGLQYGLPEGAQLFPRFTCRDTILREAKRGELDIFGPDVPDYDPNHQLFFGGEGMIATADAYADFVRMLLNHGTLNGTRFLEENTVKDIYAPHTQLDSPYGYNGYNLWVSGDSMRIKETGDVGLWIGGGYECTHFWADPKRKFVGVIMSQNHEVQAPGYEMNDAFRGALYKQIWKSEGQN